ncbi:Nucleobase-ascorbate transporter 6 [Zea mays]|uniref:Nucleobase-ascorbate transporter 6 n=1 Tax=Zea mays TaxID=4577 RepID=A0A1D6I3L9_MAIZE|nr:Nucleobase-ascorbate transporter 6 [Zea mays]
MAAAPPPKADELQPFPPKEQLPGVAFCITSPPPWPEAILLGFQHFVVMLGTTVIIPSALVPQMGGGNITESAGSCSSGITGRVRALRAWLSRGQFVAKCVEVGLPELLLLVVFSQYLPQVLDFGKSVFSRFSVLFTVAIVWLYAYILTIGGAYKNSPPKTQVHCRVDRSGLISGAPWISVPYPFQWGAPTFDAGEAFAMMMTSFIALVESTGAFIGASRYASATMIPPSIISRGVGWQGIGLLLDSFFGTANGTSVSVENIGLLALTRIGSRRVVQISAGFMIFFSVLGKFGALFASIPLPVFAGMYCLFFAYVGGVGLSLLQFCNLNSFRTKFIMGFAFFMGLSVPQYFNEYTAVASYGPVHTGARWFNDMINVPFTSKPFVAGLVAYILDNTLQVKESAVRKDRGNHWWEKFRSFKKDARSQEFYSLPFNLNKFFPSV